jgi:hypothetical protein
VEIRRFPGGFLVLDDRYAPLLVSTFVGRADLASTKWYGEVYTASVRRQASKGRKVISINDATRAERPTPDARKGWAEMADRSPADVQDAVLASYVVLDNPLLRGAVTAIGWMTDKVRGLESFKTVDQAIEAAVARLAKEGQTVDLEPGGYRLPPGAPRETG